MIYEVLPRANLFLQKSHLSTCQTSNWPLFFSKPIHKKVEFSLFFRRTGNFCPFCSKTQGLIEFFGNYFVNKKLFALKNVTNNIKSSSSKTPILLKQFCPRKSFVYHRKIRVPSIFLLLALCFLLLAPH